MLSLHINNEEKQESKCLISPASIGMLPPMPVPNKKVMMQESIGGSILVLGLIGIFVWFTHSGLSKVGDISKNGWWVGLFLIYLEAFVALVSLVGILTCNPGVIERSEDNCFPLPEEVAERLHRGKSCAGMKNIEGIDGIFCVRCFVWRPRNPRSHHCRTCNRCVRAFDHHCGVFGRCIAGSSGALQCCVPTSKDSCRERMSYSGNMPYFSMLIIMLYAAIITCGGFSIAALLFERSHSPGNS